ncbi:MAG: hypothetical protein ACK58L_22015 [Planctomycetota bacterium]
MIVLVGMASGCTESGSSAVSSSDAATGEASATFVNKACPIMGNEINEAEVTDDLVRDWKGGKVAFCCPPCLEDWDEMSEEDRARAVANPPKPGHH